MASYKTRLKHFLGLGAPSQSDDSATPEEIETFVFLANSRPLMAIDFINSWLELKSIEKLPDFVLRKPYFFDILSKVSKNDKKGKK
tara:strand:- start:41 stop:298 length:258 start_codon:yes stop_codon:yes gene_type:complete